MLRRKAPMCGAQLAGGARLRRGTRVATRAAGAKQAGVERGRGGVGRVRDWAFAEGGGWSRAECVGKERRSTGLSCWANAGRG